METGNTTSNFFLQGQSGDYIYKVTLLKYSFISSSIPSHTLEHLHHLCNGVLYDLQPQHCLDCSPMKLMLREQLIGLTWQHLQIAPALLSTKTPCNPPGVKLRQVTPESHLIGLNLTSICARFFT